MKSRRGDLSVEERLSGWDPATSLTDRERSLLAEYVDLLCSFNRRVNLVSRDSVDDAWTRHVVHSLFLGARAFPPGSTVVDWGTGGGFPLIPLAVTNPEARFVGIDAVEKKVLAVRSMVRRLGISNAEVWAGRAEAWPGRADFSVSRATAPLLTLWEWHERVVLNRKQRSDSAATWSQGLACLKGGDITEEVEALKEARPGILIRVIPLDSAIYDGQFEEKVIVSASEAEEEDVDG